MRLLCAISHHGLGHLAQTAPVVNALSGMRPETEWIVWSGLSRPALDGRLKPAFTHRHEAADIGLHMQDALRVDAEASHLAYGDFHRDWDIRVAREADWMAEKGILGVLCNVAYLPLAAAARAGIPALAFSSLNWRDIADHYLGAQADMAPVLRQMQSAYAGAGAFLRLTPALPMAWLEKGEDMPPVATLGRPRRDELRAALALSPGMRVVMLGFGGVAYRQHAALPALERIVWLVPDDWPGAGRADVACFSQAGMSFPDALASCDALVTKVGYGSFVEAAGLGLPVLYLDRPDWPETPWLSDWLARHTRLEKLSETELFSNAVGRALQRLWQVPGGRATDIYGVPIVARRILEILGN